jgi:hypothetical protein
VGCCCERALPATARVAVWRGDCGIDRGSGGAFQACVYAYTSLCIGVCNACCHRCCVCVCVCVCVYIYIYIFIYIYTYVCMKRDCHVCALGPWKACWPVFSSIVCCNTMYTRVHMHIHASTRGHMRSLCTHAHARINKR